MVVWYVTLMCPAEYGAGVHLAELDTTVPDLRLRPLTAADAVEYAALARRNVEHLSAFSSEHDEDSVRRAWNHDFLDRPPDSVIRYGIRLRDRLIGRVDLLPIEPPRYGFSYWVDHDATGKGYATAACASVLAFARSQLAATEVFAGVAHGNEASIALLRRLGFTVAAEFGSYTRFHLRLSEQWMSANST